VTDERAAVLRTAAADGLWLDVNGGSMLPALMTGERVLVRASATPRRGEVWAFVDAAGAVIVHRFVRSRGEALIFRGDSRVRSDQAIVPSQLIGRVLSVERDGTERAVASHAALRRLAVLCRWVPRAIRRRLHR
jgi:phage repressor protein C with HTH and peptisase S24 domain